jgi:hypothetical protein
MTRRRQNYPHNQTQRPETIGFRDGPVRDAKACPRRRQLSPKAAIRPPEEVQVTDSLGRWRLCLRGSPQCPGRVCPAQVGRGRNEPRVRTCCQASLVSGAARPILRAFAISFEPSLDCHSSGCNDPTRRNEGRKSDENKVRHREDGSMNCTEKFRRFAAECRAMAEFTRSPESKATWDHLAARWVQCAESIDLKSSAAMLDRMARQHRRPVRGREAA